MDGRWIVHGYLKVISLLVVVNQDIHVLTLNVVAFLSLKITFLGDWYFCLTYGWSFNNMNRVSNQLF